MTIAVNWDIKLKKLLSTGSTEETRPNINKIVYWDVKNQLTWLFLS